MNRQRYGGQKAMPRPQQHKRPDAYRQDGKVRPELFDEEAHAEARLWAEKKITKTQVRRFFGQIINDRNRFDQMGNEVSDADVKAAMAFFKAATAYAAARMKALKPLADFAAHHAKLVSSADDFRLFARHFEAIVAWHRVEEGRKR